eukprot:scaffold5981_cov146-Skeletonema_dohrnii-CCMP3373.AAC.4
MGGQGKKKKKSAANAAKAAAANRGQNAGGSEGAEETSGTANGATESTNAQAPVEVEDNSMKICNEDFRTDEGGTPGWDFPDMMEAGQSYLELPVPRKLTTADQLDMGSMLSEVKRKVIGTKRSEAWRLLRYVSQEYISAMANSDIGIGTDPERSEQHILNKKKQILVREIFATCLFYPALHETVQTVHTITEDSQKSNGKKIDFGIAGGFEGVQLGFEVANENSDWSHAKRIIAIADLRYQWATTESRIHRESLYKFLTNDCKKRLRKISGEVNAMLCHEISWFIEKYGTHVVLKCTHGYRMEKVERQSVSSEENLKTFKAGIMASVLGYAGINAGYEKQALSTADRTESSLGIKNIGSKEHMKKAIQGNMDINFKSMMENSAEEGDAGVISHDWNIMIADMLLVENSPEAYKTAGKRLRYWTQVRINDLKAGWDEGLFATSYELKFVQSQKIKKMNDKSICVTIGGLSFVHQHPGSDTESCGHVTNIHTNEAKSVRISVLDDEFALKDVLTKITVFRRVLRNRDEGVEGLVLETVIDTTGVDKPEGQWELFDLERDFIWEPKIKAGNWQAVGPKKRASMPSPKLLDETYVITIGNARAKVLR